MTLPLTKSGTNSCTALWNEQFSFDVFDGESEVSCSALQKSSSVITINIFDEVTTPRQETRIRCGDGRFIPLQAGDRGCIAVVKPRRLRRLTHAHML